MKPFQCFVLLMVGNFLACADPLQCLIDTDCPTGQFCSETQCRTTDPNPNVKLAYTLQIRPILNEGCSCHQSIHQRPWSFSADSTEADTITADLAQIAVWGYDPLPDEPLDSKRPTLAGFGIAECGFNHPGIFENRVTPRSELLRRFFSDSGELEAPRGDAAETTPLVFGVGQALPPLEQGVLNSIRRDEPSAFASEILPRIIGQCGCCHREEGNRGWKIPAQVPTDVEAIAQAREKILSLWLLASPDRSSFVSFGLGRGGGATLHPKVYENERDPRLRLLMSWISLLPAQSPDQPESSESP